MTRSATAAALAAFEAEHVPMLAFVEMQFASGTVRVCNAFESVPWNGFTWLGLGNLGTIEPIEENTELGMSGIGLQLSGVNPALIATALGEQYQGRRCNIWLAPLDRDAYFDVPGVDGNRAKSSDSKFDLRNAFTVLAEVNVSTSDLNQGYVEKTVGVTTNTQWLLFGEGGFFKLRGKKTSLFTASSAAADWNNANGVWTPIAGRYDGANLQMFVNGAPSGSPVAVSAPLDGGSGDTFIGSLPTASSYTATGKMRGVRIFGRALSNGEIAAAASGSYSDLSQWLGSFDPRADEIRGALQLIGRTGETWDVQQSGDPPARILDRGYSIVADPIGPFRFRMDTMSIDKGKTATITLTAENRLADWDRARIRRWTDEDQKADFPTDRFFEFIPELQEKEIIF